MKKMFFALATLVLAFTACTSENEVIDTPKKEVKVTVNMDKPGFGEDSRAARTGWEEGDQVFLTLSGEVYTYFELTYKGDEIWDIKAMDYNASIYVESYEEWTGDISLLIEEFLYENPTPEERILNAVYFSSPMKKAALDGINDKLTFTVYTPVFDEDGNEDYGADYEGGVCVMTCEDGTWNVVENDGEYELQFNINLIPQVTQFTVRDLQCEDNTKENYAESAELFEIIYYDSEEYREWNPLYSYVGATFTAEGIELKKDIFEECYLNVYPNADGISFYAGVPDGVTDFDVILYIKDQDMNREFNDKTLKNGDAVIMDGPYTDGAEGKWIFW